MQSLLADQVLGIEQLRQYKVGALFMEPGTGKTRTAMELVRSVPDVDYVLWLAPYRSVHPKVKGTGIKSEITKWGGFACDHEAMGIETLSSSDRTYLELIEKLKSYRNPFVVVDESLKIKNWESIRTKRIVELGKLAQFRLVLNGTPLSKNLMDLWAQMEFLSPRILKMGLAQYKQTFCEYTVMTKRIGFRTIRREWINGYHNVDHLYSLIAPYVYSAELKLDVAKVMVNVPFYLSEEDRAEYKRIKEKYLDDEMMEARNSNIFLEMTEKMRNGYCCTPNKFDRLDAIMAKHGEDQVLVFCRYVAGREACAKRYPKATVLSIQSETMSLNLQAKNVSVIFDKTWDFALIDQLTYRTWRTGQTENCTYYSLTGDVPLEGVIDRNVAGKMSLLKYFNARSVEQLRQEL